MRLGSEMGENFGRGLLQTARVGAALDLKGMLRGDRPTAIAVVIELMRGLTSLDLSQNKLDANEAQMLGSVLSTTSSLISLNLCKNGIGPTGCQAVGRAVAMNRSLREVNLLCNNIDVESAIILAQISREKKITFCGIAPGQTVADFTGQGLGPVDSILISASLEFMKSLKQV